MINTSGTYRGWKIKVGMVAETDGQMFGHCECCDEDSRFIEAFHDADDKVIREIFNFNEKNVEGFMYSRTENGNGFFWTFMFSVLPKECTQYSYLAYIFRGIDSLLLYLSEIIRVKEEKEQKEKATLMDPCHAILFPKGKVVAPAVNNRGDTFTLFDVSDPDKNVAFALTEKLKGFLYDPSNWFDVIEDIYADDYPNGISLIDLENIFSKKLKLIETPKV